MSPNAVHRLMVRYRPTLCALLLALAAGGCSTGRTIGENPFADAPRQDQVSLRVENRNIHDATIFAGSGNQRQELGTVSARGVEFFTFAWNPGTPVTLEIELAVGERYRLPPRSFTGGRRLELTVESELRRSFLSG